MVPTSKEVLNILGLLSLFLKIYLSWCTWVFAVNVYCSIRIGVQIGRLTKSCNYSSVDLIDNLFCSGHTSHPSPSLSKQNLKEKLKTSSCFHWSLWAQTDLWIWFIKAGITAWSQRYNMESSNRELHMADCLESEHSHVPMPTSVKSSCNSALQNLLKNSRYSLSISDLNVLYLSCPCR